MHKTTTQNLPASVRKSAARARRALCVFPALLLLVRSKSLPSLESVLKFRDVRFGG
jgi:hypothetical protein